MNPSARALAAVPCITITIGRRPTAPLERFTIFRETAA